MPNAKDAETNAFERILMVGRTGSGKSAQIWTLPGRRFAYIFDPNTLPTIRGCDVDYELFLPDMAEMDATLKGFNKGSRSDKPKAPKEPRVYMNWVEDLNKKAASGFFSAYQWLIFDSMTFVSRAVMDRQLYINNRYGDIEELADFRVVGSKLSEVFQTISGLSMNIYATGHISVFQDDKTKKIETQIYLPGKARNMFPLMFTNVWLAKTEEGEKGSVRYVVRTRPEPRGLQDIRCSLPGLAEEEDVTIRGFGDLASGGIGSLLEKGHKPSNVTKLRVGA